MHISALLANKEEDLGEIKKVSVTKRCIAQPFIVTPLHCAAINPNPDIIKALLKVAPEFTIPDELLRKPIHYAAACVGPGPLHYLIENNADSREGDREKNTPLHFACKYGRAKNVEILLSSEKNCNP